MATRRTAAFRQHLDPYLGGMSKLIPDELKGELLQRIAQKRTFTVSERFALLINPRILRRILLPKLFIRLARLPLIHRHIHPLAPHIAQQSRPAIPRIAPEQSHPLALRPICLLKQFLTSRLDFKLPQSYKQSCPISCFSDVGNPFEEPELLKPYPLPRRV
jgi:hypothetical protein